MEKFLAVFFYSILSFSAFAQVTKLPTYAIRTSYPIDNIKDTIAPKAGGTVKSEWDITRDSVVFHYNDKKLLELEQIFRTVININGNSYPDTSRFYRRYLYDSKDRLLSIQHWTIIGSPDPNNPRHDGIYPYGDPYYHHAIQRIDSMAYDIHDKQTFYRRYEAYDFYNSNFTMVVKNGWENDYQYDALGRLSQEDRSTWEQNTKKRILPNPEPVTFWYSYQGNTNKILSRKFYAIAPGYGFIQGSDSLFTYDQQTRITGWQTFPYYTAIDGINKFQNGYFDTTIYSGKSVEHNSSLSGNITNLETRACGGRKYDLYGRIKFSYGGILNTILNNPKYTFCINTFALNNDSGLHHYQDDSEGNLLATDSSYLYLEFSNGYTYSSNIYFDTIAYYDFKIKNIPTTIVDKSVSAKSIFTFYPNPAQSQITIITNGDSGILHIYGIEGINLISQEVKTEILLINIEDLHTGLYIIEFNGQREKLVVR